MNVRRLNNIYRSMKDRCYNPKNKDYKYYGGRGITVCKEWLNQEYSGLGHSKKGWIAFRDWALKQNYNDNLTIDRINPDGCYEPSNCRWVDIKTQANNKRCNRLISMDGKTQTVAQWCEEKHLNYWTIIKRVKRSRTSNDNVLEENNLWYRMFTYNGKTQNIKDWCSELNLKYYTVMARINKYHWSIERALGLESNCTDCATENKNCWTLKRGEQILFKEH